MLGGNKESGLTLKNTCLARLENVLELRRNVLKSNAASRFACLDYQLRRHGILIMRELTKEDMLREIISEIIISFLDLKRLGLEGLADRMFEKDRLWRKFNGLKLN